MGSKLTILPMIGELPENWKVARFGDVLSENTRNGIYKPKKFHGSGTKIVNMGEIFAYNRIGSQEMKRVELNESELQRFLLESGDLLFARRSLIASGAGKCSLVVSHEEPIGFESSIIRARPDKNQALPEFLYYLFLSSYGRYLMSTILRQVAVSGITGGDLVELKIPIPPLPEQRAIAHTLGTLDDKIELNRRMNATLETMARAIFKSWFVDFDPVRAKLDGRDTGLPSEVAALFPDGFEDSELGKIPRGWRVGTIGEIANNLRRTIRPENILDDTPYINLASMPRKNIALSEWENARDIASNKYEFKQGDFLFGKLRPYFHKIGVAAVDGVCSTDILVITPKEPKWYGLVLLHVSSNELVNYVTAASTGTKMPRTNWKDISGYQIAIPPGELAKVFSENSRAHVDMIRTNIFQSRTLAALRNTLLPRLMRGEVRVGEKMLGEKNG